jgi:predicted alpha/beta superfamily hydrolase
VALSASKANNGRGRFSEYSIFDLNLGYNVKTRPIEGKGRHTLSHLVHEMKPEIDQRYRTLSDKSNTALMGSSMGAVLVNQAAILYPDIFGRVACLSGAYFVAMDQIRQLNETADFSKLDYCYLDVGDHEEGLASRSEYLETNKALAEILKTKIPTEKLCFRIIKGGIHHESAWKTRLDEILALLFT